MFFNKPIVETQCIECVSTMGLFIVSYNNIEPFYPATGNYLSQ
jgi:hypothetical protein